MVPLGEWKIQANINGQVKNYTFFVDEYMLPLANITINVPQYVAESDPVLDLSVDVFYTFGKPVKGEIDLIFVKIRQCGAFLTSPENVTMNFPINGQLKEEIKLTDLKIYGNNHCNGNTFNISVVVKDNITKSFYYNYKTFDVIQKDIIAEFEDNRQLFRPGKTFFKTVSIFVILSIDVIQIINCYRGRE